MHIFFPGRKRKVALSGLMTLERDRKNLPGLLLAVLHHLWSHTAPRGLGRSQNSGKQLDSIPADFYKWTTVRQAQGHGRVWWQIVSCSAAAPPNPICPWLTRSSLQVCKSTGRAVLCIFHSGLVSAVGIIFAQDRKIMLFWHFPNFR